MAKLSNISGFPEWLPDQKLVENRIIEQVSRIYSSFGYTPIETPAVELLSTLSSKGVVSKEIFALHRALEDKALEDPSDKASTKEAQLALHFDLTVPFARYIAQHNGELTFPFRRYQVQKVWRGDRPQRGRFREFYQFDLDVVGRDTLPICLEAEILSAFDRAWCAIGVPGHRIRVNNRKVLLGFYSSLGLAEEQRRAAITVVDKLDKIGVEGVRNELLKSVQVDVAVAEKIVGLCSLKIPAAEAKSMFDGLAISDPLFITGREELLGLFSLIPTEELARMELDLSLARGLDYYTGVIFETYFPQYPEFGTVGAGGRYDDLASQFCNQKFPGVGASIGLTRLLDLIFTNKLLPIEHKTVSQVLVAVYDENQRPACIAAANSLRAVGANVEVFTATPKLGKQIEYAERKGIRYVVFVNPEDSTVEVKDLVQRQQAGVADLAEWWRGVAGDCGSQ